MPFNYLGDLRKREIVEALKQQGFDVKSVHALNLILEKMGLVEQNGSIWMTTLEGVKRTIYRSRCNADAWHPSVVKEIADFLSKK